MTTKKTNNSKTNNNKATNGNKKMTTKKKTNSKANSKTVAKGIQSGLGALVWWDLYQTKVTPDLLRFILKTEGLDNVIVPDIDGASAVRQAAREWSQGRGNADRFKTEVVYEDANQVEIGLLKRDRINDHEIQWIQQETITFDVGSDDWAMTGQTLEADSFRELANDRRTYHDHRFIRPEVIQRTLDNVNAFRLRRQGGVVYVPTQYMTELETLQRVVRQIGASEFHIAHVSATEESREAIGSSARKAVGDSLEELRTQITKWTEAQRRPGERRCDNVIAEFAELRSKAKLYALALQVNLSDLEKEITAAETEAKNVIDSIADDRVNLPSLISVKVRARAEELVTNSMEIEDGKRKANCNVILECGYPSGATTHRGSWTMPSANVRALRELGYSPSLAPDGSGVVLTPWTEEKAS